MKPAMFCLALRPGLKRFREEFEREGVEAFAYYMDDVSLDLMGITASTIRAFAFLRRGLEAIGIVISTTKIVALPQKATPRRRGRFRASKVSMSALPTKEG